MLVLWQTLSDDESTSFRGSIIRSMPVISVPLARELVDPGMMMNFVELAHSEVSSFLPASIASRRLDSPMMQADVLLTPPVDSPVEGVNRLRGKSNKRSVSEFFNENSSVQHATTLQSNYEGDNNF